MTTAITYDDVLQAQVRPKVIQLGPNLYGATFALMKLVPARMILRNARERGDLGPGTLIAETTSGTFGLALAMQAALMETNLVLVSDPVIDANLHRRLTDLGASVEIVAQPGPTGGYQQARMDRLAEIREEHPDHFCPEQYSNPDNPRSYALVAETLSDALGQVDFVIGPVGSGGSMCGTASFLRSVSPETRAIGVDTHRSVLFGQEDGKRPLRGLGNSLFPPNLDHSVFDEVHWISAGESFAATRALHRGHALYQGPTSGAAFHVAQWTARNNPDALCVVMLPDEGYRYQETVYNDEWLLTCGYGDCAAPREPVELDHPSINLGAWSRFAWGRRTYSEAVHGRDCASTRMGAVR